MSSTRRVVNMICCFSLVPNHLPVGQSARRKSLRMVIVEMEAETPERQMFLWSGSRGWLACHCEHSLRFTPSLLLQLWFRLREWEILSCYYSLPSFSQTTLGSHDAHDLEWSRRANEWSSHGPKVAHQYRRTTGASPTIEARVGSLLSYAAIGPRQHKRRRDSRSPLWILCNAKLRGQLRKQKGFVLLHSNCLDFFLCLSCSNALLFPRQISLL